MTQGSGGSRLWALSADGAWGSNATDTKHNSPGAAFFLGSKAHQSPPPQATKGSCSEPLPQFLSLGFVVLLGTSERHGFVDTHNPPNLHVLVFSPHIREMHLAPKTSRHSITRCRDGTGLLTIRPTVAKLPSRNTATMESCTSLAARSMIKHSP